MAKWDKEKEMKVWKKLQKKKLIKSKRVKAKNNDSSIRRKDMNKTRNEKNGKEKLINSYIKLSNK